MALLRGLAIVDAVFVEERNNGLYFPSPYEGLGKLWPVSQIPPTVLVKKSFMGAQPCPFIYMCTFM